MLTTQNYMSTSELFQGKSQSVQELYQTLLEKLNEFGPVQEIIQTLYISLENRKRFATALIRDQSIKLVLRTRAKISSPRIKNREVLPANHYDYTVLLSSKKDIDPELLAWLREAYCDSE